MIWAVLKPHYWILDRKFRSVNRYLIILVITLLLFAGQWDVVGELEKGLK